MISILYRSLTYIFSKIRAYIDYYISRFQFLAYGVKVSSFTCKGIPYVMIARHANGLSIGDNFSMNNGLKSNPIGCPQACVFWVGNNSSITIGNNVGISQTALISHCSISIGNNVKIGGGTCIYTTDFHSLDPKIRASRDDQVQSKCAPVHICDNVFIGAHTIILKGVTIGENSIVGAGSVVTKSIPANQIWGGNPIKFIREL